MRLNVQTDYALRLLMYLAAKDQGLTTIAESAARYNISKNHLMKVAHQLGRFGYIETIRGRSGGLKLARKAGKINIGEIVRKFEEESALVACFPSGGGGCLITPACRLKSALANALDAFFDTLDQYTLEDLAGRNPELRQLLISE